MRRAIRITIASLSLLALTAPADTDEVQEPYTID